MHNDHRIRRYNQQNCPSGKPNILCNASPAYGTCKVKLFQSVFWKLNVSWMMFQLFQGQTIGNTPFLTMILKW